MFAVGNRTPSNVIVALVVLTIIVAVSMPIIRGVVRRDGDPRLTRVLGWSLALHLLCSSLQIFVTDHFYHGVADYLRYESQGTVIAHNFTSGHFTLAGSGANAHLLGDGAMSIVVGVVFSIVGVDQLAAFFIFAWLSFLGALCFYRAFTITFPHAEHRRYALMLFFLPSLLFWTADASKEAFVSLALGIAALGAARVLARQPRGYPLVVLGILLGVYIRPNEIVLLLGGFAVAMAFRPPPVGRIQLQGFRRAFSWVFLITVLILSGLLTAKFVHANGGTIGGALSSVSKNNSAKNGATSELAGGFGSSNVPFSKNPLLYPRDVYTVLFDPLPFLAHNTTQLLAAFENTVIIVLIATSWRRLKLLPRVAVQRPYVLLCAAYCAAFLYAFAALGNLGLIDRERTLLFPFLLVLLAIPIAGKGQPPRYPWELRRRRRRSRRAGAGVSARA